MPKRILLVDDSDRIRRVMRRFLEEHADLEICGEAAHGAEAVEMAPVLNPDVIVLDFSMPRMSGLEVAKALRPSLPLTPKILFTMHDGIISEQEARSAGIDSVLIKSDGIENLVSEIRRLFAIAHPSAEGSLLPTTKDEKGESLRATNGEAPLLVPSQAPLTTKSSSSVEQPSRMAKARMGRDVSGSGERMK